MKIKKEREAKAAKEKAAKAKAKSDKAAKDKSTKEAAAKERKDWFDKTRNSPAAKAGFSDEQRWALQQKHRKWKTARAEGRLKKEKFDPTKGKTYRRKWVIEEPKKETPKNAGTKIKEAKKKATEKAKLKPATPKSEANKKPKLKPGTPKGSTTPKKPVPKKPVPKKPVPKKPPAKKTPPKKKGPAGKINKPEGPKVKPGLTDPNANIASLRIDSRTRKRGKRRAL